MPQETALERQYKQFLSTLPCLICKDLGASQAAHIHLYGEKSKGKKVDWRQMIPLCHEGANGCHAKVDQYNIKIDRNKTVNAARTACGFWLNHQPQKATEIFMRLRCTLS